MAKAVYLKLVGCKNYHNTQIIGRVLVKEEVVRLLNPAHVAHLSALSTVIGEDNEKFWFKNVTNDPVYVEYEEKFLAAQAPANKATVAPTLEDDEEEEEEEEAPAKAKSKTTQRAPRTAKPATKKVEE